MPVSYFFDDIEDGCPAPSQDDPLIRRETLEMVRHYYGMSPDSRRAIYNLIKSMPQVSEDARQIPLAGAADAQEPRQAVG